MEAAEIVTFQLSGRHDKQKSFDSFRNTELIRTEINQSVLLKSWKLSSNNIAVNIILVTQWESLVF